MAYRLLRNTADAQDLVQDTCLAACANLDAIAASEPPIKWLLKVQHNRFIDLARRRGRAPVVSTGYPDGPESVSDLPDPEQLLEQFQSEQLLERAFLQLDAVQRTLLSLRAEGYDLREIESITGVSATVLSARLNRARVRLAQLIAEFHHGAAEVRHIGSAR
jgi:RNA polymerase sigma-70 factor (ECF subfamily)